MEIVVYHLTYCPYCQRLLKLLEEKNLEYKAIVCDSDKEKFKEKNNFPTFPQVFIDGFLIGGLSETNKLFKSGFLESKDTRLIIDPNQLEKMNESNYLYLKALNFFASDTKKARELLQKAIELNPDNLIAQEKLESLS